MSTNTNWSLILELDTDPSGFSVYWVPEADGSSRFFALILGAEAFSDNPGKRETEIQALSSFIKAWLEPGEQSSAMIAHLGAESAVWCSDHCEVRAEPLNEVIERSNRSSGLFGPWWAPTHALIRAQTAIRHVMNVQIAYVCRSGKLPVDWFSGFQDTRWNQATWPKSLGFWLVHPHAIPDLPNHGPMPEATEFEQMSIQQLPAPPTRENADIEYYIVDHTNPDAWECFSGWQVEKDGVTMRMIAPEGFFANHKLKIAKFTGDVREKPDIGRRKVI